MTLIEIADGAKDYESAIAAIVDAFKHEHWTGADAMRNLAAARVADQAARYEAKKGVALK
jgi:hypothetical protein